MDGIKKAFVTGITQTSTKDLEGVGTIRIEGPKIYKWVQFNNGAGNVAAVAGNQAYYYTNTGYASHVVTSDQTDEVGSAGVFCSAPADLSYCWVQVKGPVTLNQSVTGTPADGDPITIGTTDGAFAKAAESDTAAVYKQVCGIITNTSTKLAALDCPL